MGSQSRTRLSDFTFTLFLLVLHQLLLRSSGIMSRRLGTPEIVCVCVIDRDTDRSRNKERERGRERRGGEHRETEGERESRGERHRGK